jgi:hypothetical protein
MGKMPLTLFLVTAIVLIYLWLRRMALAGKPLVPKVTAPAFRQPAGPFRLPFPATPPIVRPPSDGIIVLPPANGILSPWGN